MNNLVFKKGLVSVAVASVLAGVAYAETAINSVKPKTHYSGGGDNNFTVADINISERLVNSVSTSDTATLKIIIPANVRLANANGSELNWSAFNQDEAAIYVATSWDNSEDNNVTLWIDLNGTDNKNPLKTDDKNDTLAAYKLFELGRDNENNVILAPKDIYNSGFKLLSISGAEINATDGNTTVPNDLKSTTNANELNMTKVAKVEREGENGPYFFKLNLKAKQANGIDTLSISGLKLRPASSTASGDVVIKFEGTYGISNHDVKVAELWTQPAKLELNGSVANKFILADAATPDDFADFNVTIADNMKDKDGNISLVLNNAKFVAEQTNKLIAKSGSYFNEYNGSTQSDANITLYNDNKILDLNMSTLGDGNTTVNIKGKVVSTTTTPNTDITVNFAGSSDAKKSDGNYSALAPMTTPLKIATVITDGVKVEYANAGKSAADSIVVPGVNFQTISSNTDINISEYFNASFAPGKTITLTLPSGYTWAAAPTIYLTNGLNNGAQQPAVNPDGGTYTIQFGANAEVNSSVETNASNSTKQTITIQNMKINVPALASNGDVVKLAIGGTLFSSSKQPSLSEIGIATVKTTAANVTTESNLSDSKYTFGTGTSSSGQELKIKIKEPITGIIQPGTITITLNGGATFASSGTNPTISTSGNTFTINPASTTYSDGNKTMTLVISAKGNTGGTDANTTIKLPDISFANVKTPTIITATIGGTAGIAGTVDIAKIVYGNSAKNNVVVVSAGSVEKETGELEIIENIKTGLSNNKAFRIVAPAGVTFTGSYAVATKSATASTYSSYSNKTGALSSTFNTNDTIEVKTSDLNVDDNSIKHIKLKFKVNISPSATEGIKVFTIADGNSSANSTSGIVATSAKLLYIGSSALKQTESTTGFSNKDVMPTPEQMAETAIVKSSDANETISTSAENNVLTVKVGGVDKFVVVFNNDGTVTVTGKDGATYTIKSIKSRAATTTYTITVNDLFGNPVDLTVERTEGSSSSSSSVDVVAQAITTLTSKAAWNINGSFYQTGSGAWDWVYCVQGTTACYQLEGFDTTTGYFQYKGGSNPTVVTKPSGDPAGYFVQYGPGAYDWTYTPAGMTNQNFKLGGKATGIDWTPLTGLKAMISGNTISYTE